MKRNYLLLAIAILTFIGIKSCKDEEKVIVTIKEPFKAIDLPSKLANGDAFPTDSTQIAIWLSNPNVDENGVQNDPNIIGHSWGLWQALTELTDQSYNGRKLRRFETWYTPQDVINATNLNKDLESLERDNGSLQFRKKFSFGHDKDLNTTAGDISGRVRYNPSMAQRALEERYFDHDVLKGMIKTDTITTVEFKPGDVMLKPIYRVMSDLNKVEGKEDTYYFNVWAGKQDAGRSNTVRPGQTAPDSTLFSKMVYVTTNLEAPMLDSSGDVPVYSVKNFIHFTMTEAEAYRYNRQDPEGQEFEATKKQNKENIYGDAKAGDAVVLLGMHASTRESRRWTWQSFFWSENPDNPVFPSSQTIASGRDQLSPALDFPTNNYAVTIAYSMMSPALPYETGGEPIDISKANVTSVYGLNPYIEGTFNVAFFKGQGKFYKDNGYEKQFIASNNEGISSNCMSCHSQAAYNGNDGDLLPFFADQYVNRDAPWFKGRVQLDFAWSLFPGFEAPIEAPKK